MTFTINADIIKWLHLILCIKASRNLKRRGGRDGLRRSIGNAVYVNSIPWVRIPSSPPRQSKLYIACSDFFAKNQSSLMPLLLLIRKRSRSHRLFLCKHTRNAFGSLRTFCESAFGTYISIAQLSLCFTVPPPFHKTYWVLREPYCTLRYCNS